MEQSSKCSNRFFKSKCTRDNVTLHKTSQINRISRALRSVLDEREQVWYDAQKKLQVEHIEQLIQKGKSRDDYLDRVIAKCRSWDGLCRSIEDMNACLSGKSIDEQRTVLRHEITFQKFTHPTDGVVSHKQARTIDYEVQSRHSVIKRFCARRKQWGGVFANRR